MEKEHFQTTKHLCFLKRTFSNDATEYVDALIVIGRGIGEGKHQESEGEGSWSRSTFLHVMMLLNKSRTGNNARGLWAFAVAPNF